jgi:hypothetical protein
MAGMWVDAGVRKDFRLFSGPRSVKTVAARPRTIAECNKRALYTFRCPSGSSHTTPSTPKVMAFVSKMGHTIVMGLPMLRIQRQNPSVGSEPPRATRVRDEVTQRMPSNWRIRSPIRGTRHTQASCLSLDRQVSFTPLRVG